MLFQELMIFGGGVSTGLVFYALGQALLHFWQRRQAVRVVASTQTLDASSMQTLAPLRWWKKRWARLLGRWCVLVVAPLVVNGLYASFALARATLHHIDPVVFAALQLVVLMPLAVVALCVPRVASRAAVQQGLLGGIPLGMGVVCIALSLRSIGIIPTAMLTALDGIMASLIAWLVFHQRLSLYTCLAAACATCGALLLWWIAPSHWQTDLLSLACGGLFTLYAFHVERQAVFRGTFR